MRQLSRATLGQAARSVIQQLEQRCLLSASFANGRWAIAGDDAPAHPCDTIVIEPYGKGARLRAVVNGVVIDTRPAKAVSRIDIRAGAGDDQVTLRIGRGFRGPIRAFGEAGADLLLGGAAAESLDGGLGNDTLRGGDGNDTLSGGDGYDSIEGNAGNDRIDGGSDPDEIRGGAGADVILGGAGSDFVSGDAGNDRLQGDAGNDILLAGDGADTLHGGSGHDVMEGGNGNDRLIGDSANDTLSGDAGNDYLNGGDGDDLVSGDAGNDTLVCNLGNDIQDGGPGKNRVDGGRAARSSIASKAAPASANVAEDGTPLVTSEDIQTVEQNSPAVSHLDLDALKATWIDAAVSKSAALLGTNVYDGRFPYAGSSSGPTAAAATPAAESAVTSALANGVVQGTGNQQDTVSDGRYIYAIFGGELVILDASQPDQTHVVSRTRSYGLNGYDHVYLDGERLTVLGGDSDYLKVTIFDISDRSAPAIVESTDYNEGLVEARQIGHTIQVVLLGNLSPNPFASTQPEILEGLAGSSGSASAIYSSPDVSQQVGRLAVSDAVASSDASVLDASETALATPRNLVASVDPNLPRIDLSWDPVSGADDYWIDRSEDGGLTWGLYDTSLGATTWVDYLPVPNTTLFYRVSAHTDSGDESNPSAPVSAMVPPNAHYETEVEYRARLEAIPIDLSPDYFDVADSVFTSHPIINPNGLLVVGNPAAAAGSLLSIVTINPMDNVPGPDSAEGLCGAQFDAGEAYSYYDDGERISTFNAWNRLPEDVCTFSGNSVYITARRTETVAGQPTLCTDIFKFSFGEDGPTFEASGEVPGWIDGSDALDEYDGYLRVATTSSIGGRGTDENSGRDWSFDWSKQSNNILVLSQSGNRLTTVGSVTGLAAAEQVYATRFDGARGYMTTFGVTDPFYVLDLSDPTHPTVMGQVVLPGFSHNLVPIGDNLVLGIGREVDGIRILGLDVSLFDVSDPAQPARTAVYHVSGDPTKFRAGVSSAIEPSTAILPYFDDSGMLLLDVFDPTTSQANPDLADYHTDILRLDPETGFTLQGQTNLQFGGYFGGSIRVGDNLYSLRYTGPFHETTLLVVVPLNDPTTVLATLDLTPPTT